MVDPDANLEAAEKVAELLSRHQVDAVVIGAVALAAYRYIRQTDDIDLGVNADVPTLRRIVTSLHEAGLKSKSDIVEVLARNPECDVAEVERVCNSYRLRGLKNVLQDPR